MQSLPMTPELDLRVCHGECHKCEHSYYVPAIQKMLCTRADAVSAKTRELIVGKHAASAQQYAAPRVELPKYVDHEAALLQKGQLTYEEYAARLNRIAGFQSVESIQPSASPEEEPPVQSTAEQIVLATYRNREEALSPDTRNREMAASERNAA